MEHKPKDSKGVNVKQYDYWFYELINNGLKQYFQRSLQQYQEHLSLTGIRKKRVLGNGTKNSKTKLATEKRTLSHRHYNQ